MQTLNKPILKIHWLWLMLPLVLACKNDYLIDLSPETMPAEGTWLVDEQYVQWGCSGQDCIPNLTNPAQVPAGSIELNYLDDSDLVVGVKQGGQYMAYPHPIMDWHEVVNEPGYTISYCPLTGSALVISGDDDYGVSGLLYNSNLIMYDKESNSFWPQMFIRAAAGEKRGDELNLGFAVETTWKTWRLLFPDTRALSVYTGYSRNYHQYPYGSYRTNRSILFPVNHLDNRLHVKARVLGVMGDVTARAYPIQYMGESTIIHTQLDSLPIVVFGSAVHNYAVAFKTDRHFTAGNTDISSGVLEFSDDGSGSTWNIMGEAISGPATGEVLEPAKAFIAYWFAWAAFHPQSELWNPNQQ